MWFTKSYKKRVQKNTNKSISKLKKETAHKTDREILLEILREVKTIGNSIVGLLVLIFMAYLFGWFR